MKKKPQTEEILDMENPGKGIGTTYAGITNRIQNTEEEMLAIEDIIQEVDPYVKENTKSKKFLTYPGNKGHHVKT